MGSRSGTGYWRIITSYVVGRQNERHFRWGELQRKIETGMVHVDMFDIH